VETLPPPARLAKDFLSVLDLGHADLERLLAIDPSRVEVVYPGVGPRFCPLPAETTAPVRRRLSLPDHFVLFVSTLEPRKNLVRLLEAFAQIVQTDNSNLHLVIAGRRGWLALIPGSSPLWAAASLPRGSDERAVLAS